jgi:guanylate kinase
MIIVITGASGSGKSTLSNFIVSNIKGTHEIVPMTNRPKQSYETDYYPYTFLDNVEFEEATCNNTISTVTRGDYKYALTCDLLEEDRKNDNVVIIRCGQSTALQLGSFMASNNIRGACLFTYCRPTVLLDRLALREKQHKGQLNVNLTYSRVNDIYVNSKSCFWQLEEQQRRCKSFGRIIPVDTAITSVHDYPKFLIPTIKYLDPVNYTKRISDISFTTEGEYNAA